jgi:hypothetical protein
VAEHGEIHIRDWNGHPTDVSPARHLLLKLGFVQVSDRRKGFVYDGMHAPDQETIARAEREMPELFEHVGKEKAPVEYDAEWIISRSNPQVRSKVRELIGWLRRTLPQECELVFRPRQLLVRYRGLRCVSPYIQQKQIYLQITHKGWTRGILIKPDTDLDAPEFVSQVLERFGQVRGQIDSLLDDHGR